MRNDRPHDPAVLRTLRRFFERRLTPSWDDTGRTLRPLVSHLMERTVARAALRAAATNEDSAPQKAPADWKHHLMVAALTELRALNA